MRGLQNKKIIITGGAGFIGTHLVKKLLKLKIFPVLVDQINPSERNIKGVRYIKADLTKPSDVRKMFTEVRYPDIIIHLATKMPQAGEILGGLTENVKANFFSTVNILNHLPSSLEQFIYTSTIDVYGAPLFLPINENHPTTPATYYGAAKLASEKFLQIFFSNKKSSLTILRLSQVYGFGESKIKIIPIFIDSIINDRSPIIYGKGEDVRDYVYVEDVARAVILSLHKKVDGVFNIAAGKGHELKEVLNLICKLAKKDVSYIYKPRKKKMLQIIIDISRAKKKLGYSPTIGFKSGLKRYIKKVL